MLSKNQARHIRSLHLKKFRDREKLFIAEGVKSVSEILLQKPALLETVYAESPFSEAHKEALSKTSAHLVQVSAEELRSISLQSNPNSVLAVCRQEPPQTVSFDQTNFSFYLDDIRDPGNFGTILRICDWFGARSLFCSPSSCELYNPKVIQSSMGAFLRVQVRYDALENVVSQYSISQIYGAVLDGGSIYDEPLGSGLVLIGNEANGISDVARALINRPLTIPAEKGSGTESLNAAVATGIIASEFFRKLRG